MFNLELPWRVAKGAVSAATYRTPNCYCAPAAGVAAALGALRYIIRLLWLTPTL